MPNDLIELGLNAPEGDKRSAVLLSLADRLLSLIGQHVSEGTARKSAGVLKRVDGWRAALRQERRTPDLASLARQIVADCESLLDHLQAEASDREAEFVDLVNTLRGVVGSLHSTSVRFDEDMTRTTGELARIGDLQDIRELKKALAQGVAKLRATIVERQQTEAQTTERLSAQVRLLEENLKQARVAAATDALTGVPNRGGFDAALRAWLTRAASENRGFTLGLVDLDDFKSINDAHGHQVGDRVLIAATELLTDEAEHGEVVSRFGGDEFGFLMHTGSAARARARLTEVLHRISPAYEYHVDGQRRLITFTFSAGVAEFASGDSAESLLKRADEALYDAKRKGKKRVETRSTGFLHALVG